MKTIREILAQQKLDTENPFWHNYIRQVTEQDVQKALQPPHGIYRIEKLAALISPAAEAFLEQMAHSSRQLTIQRFGRTVRLYAPLYLSNYCVNSCRYCGFNQNHNFKKTRLSIEEAEKEAETIAKAGFTDILLVSGHDRKYINVPYLKSLAHRLRRKFSSISIEIYQLEKAEYQALFDAGIEGVTIYQETYNRNQYNHFHPAGPKADYERRLEAPEQTASAGMREIGLGALLGLGNWQLETLAMAEHAACLMKKYWKSHISFSFPRLKPAYEVGPDTYQQLSDRNLTQMITALRLCFADAGMVLSTREPAYIRDNLINLGITRISAGSKTNPGGYSGSRKSTCQFEIDDSRTPAEISRMIKNKGLDVVWKDWDREFTSSSAVE